MYASLDRVTPVATTPVISPRGTLQQCMHTLRRAWEAQARGISLGAHVPRGISAESRRRLFQAVVSLTGTPLEVCFCLLPI